MTMPTLAQEKFILVTWGSLGDVHPFLGLAVALKSRGHQVTLLTHEAFRGLATALEIAFHPIGTMTDIDAILKDPDLWHPRKGFEVVWRSSVPTQKLITDFILNQPDAGSLAVIAHPLAMPGAVAARDCHAGMRLIGTFMAPANLRTCHDPLFLGPLQIPRWLPHSLRRWLWRRVDGDILDPLTLPDVNSLRKSFDLAPVSHYADMIYQAPDFSVTLFPPWFGPTMPDWPAKLLRGEFILFDGLAAQAMSEDLQEFLAAGTAPIVFSFGSAMQHAGKAYQAALDACLQLQRRGIFLTMFKEQIPLGLPPTVKRFDYAPFCRLLPQVAAFVHHGGVGSTAEALRAGVPQLVVPMAHDQFDNAARVVALGAGLCLPRVRLSRRKLQQRLASLLDNQALQQKCRNIAAHFDQAEPANTVACLIEQNL